jgi:hypothetical protein
MRILNVLHALSHASSHLRSDGNLRSRSRRPHESLSRFLRQLYELFKSISKNDFSITVGSPFSGDQAPRYAAFAALALSPSQASMLTFTARKTTPHHSLMSIAFTSVQATRLRPILLHQRLHLPRQLPGLYLAVRFSVHADRILRAGGTYK